MAVVRLMVGLGNPGAEYADTRHNAGFRFLETLCRERGCALKTEARFLGRTGRCRMGDQEVLLLAPATFMNASGDSVAALSHYYKIAPEAILVVHDELDLPPGTVRLKAGGGNGGHNGLSSIQRSLGSAGFLRLRLGIGRPPPGREVVGYVLGRAPTAEEHALDEAIARALAELPEVVAGRLEPVMNRLHSVDNGA